MDSIVSKLAEIDATAAAIVANAGVQKSALEKEMQQKRDQFDKDLELKTSDKLAELQATLDAKSKDIIKAQNDLHGDTLQSLEDDFEKNHEKYAQEIFMRIIED